MRYLHRFADTWPKWVHWRAPLAYPAQEVLLSREPRLAAQGSHGASRSGWPTDKTRLWVYSDNGTPTNIGKRVVWQGKSFDKGTLPSRRPIPPLPVAQQQRTLAVQQYLGTGGMTPLTRGSPVSDFPVHQVMPLGRQATQPATAREVGRATVDPSRPTVPTHHPARST